MSEWQIARHQVAIAGRVTDSIQGKPLASVEVAITGMPVPFRKKLETLSIQYGERWATMSERPDKTNTRADGLFYFLDLPDGKYTVSASLPSAGRRYGAAQGSATVSRDTEGRLKMASVNLALQPTTVNGKITATGHKAGVMMAEVRVKGSGERAFSDAQGQYILSGIEPGKRTVLVLKQGFRAASQLVTIAEPGGLHTANFALVLEAG